MPTTARSRARRRRAALAAAGVLFSLGAAVTVGAVLHGPAALVGAAVLDVDHVGTLPHGRPASTSAATDGPTSSPSSGDAADGATYLLVGSDARSDGRARGDGGGDGAWEPGQQRSDVTMLVHLLPDGDVVLASVPRDSWVDVPGLGMAKVNAAYSLGGPGLLAQTLELQTGVVVDHFAAVDFDGLVALTDAVGGVEVEAPRRSSYQGHDFVAGTNHLDGEAALAFVRQRKNLPRGDLDRVENQQRFLGALADRVVSRETATDPRRLAAVVAAVRDHVSTDDGTSPEELRDLALAMGGASSGRVVAGTAPVLGLGDEDGQSVVYLDTAAGGDFWRAFREGDVDAFRDLS